jgi:hypothetical protein
MKLNFWQWLGVILLIVGAAWWYYDNKIKNKPQPPVAPKNATMTSSPA